jgi:nicotinate phosphoribosyltransferase
MDGHSKPHDHATGMRLAAHMTMHGITSEQLALFTDLYELTMLQAYWREELLEAATFSLFVRRLDPRRNFLLACGIDDVLAWLEDVRFTEDALRFLAARPEFRPEFLEWLSGFRFTGDVWAVREGTPVFANEPILELRAPLPEAQLAETLILNQVHVQTTLASKAARVVLAARGRPVIDFGMRRMHGADAAMQGARAFHIAGLAGTSNVLAGRIHGVPIMGTMAHSYIQVHDDEMDAFRRFSELYPGTVLLVDTYDTLEGVRRVIRLARELGPAFDVGAIRLDSGDLAQLAIAARRILDDAGLSRVRIVASGGLDEYEIERILGLGAPIDSFGVGTAMGVSADAPALDIVYKLTEYAGEGRIKLSPDKPILPGRKQIFRQSEDRVAIRDVIASVDEEHPGRPLLAPVMQRGRRVRENVLTLDEARTHAAEEVRALPQRLRELAPADPPYPVEVSEELLARQASIAAALRAPAPAVRAGGRADA